VLKWLTLSLFAYVGVVFMSHLPWRTVAHDVLIPHISFTAEYLTVVVALLGTTISPYLFFWQAEEEVEEVKERDDAKAAGTGAGTATSELQRIRIDTYVGMGLSNLVALFIILTTAATLNATGSPTSRPRPRPPRRLRPIAGQFAFAIFAIGIIGTGMLALPVLAGSSAMRWARPSLARGTGPQAAPGQGLLWRHRGGDAAGRGAQLQSIDPIKALFWSAVINGVVAVPVMGFMMHLSCQPKVMGDFCLSRGLKMMGWLATAVMTAAAVGLFATWGK